VGLSGAATRGGAYARYLADGLTRTLVAAKAREMSASHQRRVDRPLARSSRVTRCRFPHDEAARRAVNAILARTGSKECKCEVWPLSEPALFAPAGALHKLLFKLGRPPAQSLGMVDGRVAASRPMKLAALLAAHLG
jgi:hypothetical protein